MAEFTNSNVRVGTRIAVKVDEKIIGYAQGARCTDDYGLEPVHVLNQLQCLEYVPTAAHHQIALTLLVMRNQSLYKSNLVPTGAGRWDNLPAQDQAATDGSAWGSLRELHGKTYTVSVQDSQPDSSGNVHDLVTYYGCYYASGNIEVSANRVMMADANFVALDRGGSLTST